MTAFLVLLFLSCVTTLCGGCASKQYIMKECKTVVAEDGKPSGEMVCKKNSILD